MTNRLRHALAAVCALLLLAVLAAPAFAQFVRTGRVQAFETVVWDVWVPGGQTRVIVAGDGDTDLDCWVYDRFGFLLGSDTDITDLCIVEFRNPSSGELSIYIRNLGSVYNAYELIVD